jgi:DNA-binding GntR family transcriptional regulator
LTVTKQKLIREARSKSGQLQIRPPRGKGTDYVYLALRSMIVRLELAPGQKIDDSAIADMLGVSRTPVREAILRLSADKLVAILPNRGAQVAPLNALELTSYFEALELTHRALQHWACLRRSEKDLAKIDSARVAYENAVSIADPVAMSEGNLDFHRAIADASGNRMFDDFVMKLSVLGMRIGWIWYRDVAEGSHEKEAARTVAEHRQIAAAIRNRAVEEAERLASVHIGAFRDQVFAKLSLTLGGAVPISYRAT